MKKKIMKKQRGLTLIELLVVFVILAIFVGIVYQNYKESEISRKNLEIAEFVQKVTPSILARHPGEIATLNTAAAIALDFAPNYEVTVGGVKSIVLPGTTEVTINPNGTNTATVLSLNGMSSLSCVDLVKKLWNGYSVIQVGGNNVKSTSADLLTANAASLDTECSNATNSVSIEISNFG